LIIQFLQLFSTGFTWQDDYTQYVMAQELANLPKSYPRHPEASSLARTSKQNIGDERRHSLESDTTLAETLRRYLPYLGALSLASASDALPRMTHDKPAPEGDDPFPESILTYVAHTSALTYPPGPRVELPEDLSLRTLSQLQPDELSPKVDSSVDRHHLMAALSAYTAQRPLVPPRDGDLGPRYLLRAPPRISRPLLAAVAPQKWPSPPGDPTDAASKGEGALLQSFLKDLRKQQTDTGSLSPLELDEVADLMADVMQRVGPGGGGNSARRTTAGDPGDPEAAFRGDTLRDNKVQDDDDRVYAEVHRLSTKLGDFLQDRGSRLSAGVPVLAKPFKTEMKKSEHPETSLSSEEESAGVENVKSQTYSKDLLEKKPNPEPAVELQNWVQGVLTAEQRLPAGAWEPPSSGLQLEVKSSEEEEYGYIVTSNAPLHPEEGRQLMEDIARLLQVPDSIFADVEILGPAVTFKVNINAQNVTTADVAKATVDNKDKLEKTSGLKILQTGMGSGTGQGEGKWMEQGAQHCQGQQAGGAVQGTQRSEQMQRIATHRGERRKDLFKRSSPPTDRKWAYTLGECVIVAPQSPGLNPFLGDVAHDCCDFLMDHLWMSWRTCDTEIH
ncbi:receptor-type tyrosine-protein phosphatase N2-like, partial [Carlito syrichta]|uniref:Receptor-type tyrosine-protein phosphatase N2-like n=1 Tax=Carlito syrichta TaxID=1868482 RepID=A0A1U7UAX7_CARSF